MSNPFKRSKKHDPNQQDLFHVPINVIRPHVEEFISEWNSRIWLPKIIATERQCKLIRMTLERPFFSTHWRDALAILPKCSFLLFKKKPRMDIDWFCDSDNFDKIIEGKYIDQKEEKQTKHKAVRTEDGEEKIV